MQVPYIDVDVEVPEEVQVAVDGDTVTVEGPNGEASRTFTHPKMTIRSETDGLEIHVEDPRQKDRALAGTWASHLRNMITGVRLGFEAELKIVYSHFPIKAKVEGDRFVVENFLGERHPREARIMGNVEVEVQGDTVSLQGNDKEAVGQTAANIESVTRIQGYDLRVFQDGIYITQKPRPVEP